MRRLTVAAAADGCDVRQLTQPAPSDHGTCHTGPAPSPNGTVIAYDDIAECDRGYDATIEAIDPAERKARLGRFSVGAGFDPAWSPDGPMVAFASVSDEFGSGNGIKVASSDGSRARRLYRDGPASGPAFSPNGRWVAFSTDRDLWLVRSDGTGLRRC